jgi:hypothetical protein
MEKHISFQVETLDKFINTSLKEYDLIIYDLDKEVFAKGTPNLSESTNAAITVMQRMILTHYSTSFFIILSSIQFVATHVAQAMVYLHQKGFHVQEFFHFPHSKNEFYPTQDITKDINVINETHWVRAVVVSKSLKWNEDYDVYKYCSLHFGDERCQRSNCINNFEAVPSCMRLVDGNRHSAHSYVKPSSTISNILCKFFPHISSEIQPSGRIPNVLCIDSGMFIIPMDLILNFGVNVDILEASADAWNSWCQKSEPIYDTRDNNMTYFASKLNLLFREIVNEGVYRKNLMNPQFVSQIKKDFQHLLSTKSVEHTICLATTAVVSPYCLVCGSCDMTTAASTPVNQRFTCVSCSNIEESRLSNPDPGSFNIYTTDLYFKYFSSSTAWLERTHPTWHTMRPTINFDNQFNKYKFRVGFKKDHGLVTGFVTYDESSVNTIQDGDVIGSLWGFVGNADAIQQKVENKRLLAFPLLQLFPDWNPIVTSSSSNVPYLLSSPYCFASWIPNAKNKKKLINVKFRINYDKVDHAISNTVTGFRMVPAGLVDVVAVSYQHIF